GDAAVFHDEDLFEAGSDERTVLDAASAPTMDGDTLVLDLELDTRGLGAVFDEHGALRWRRLSLAQHRRDAVLAPQPVRVQLGDRSPDGEHSAPGTGDVFELGFGPGDRARAIVRRYDRGSGVLDLEPVGVVDPEKLKAPFDLTFYGLAAKIDPAD